MSVRKAVIIHGYGDVRVVSNHPIPPLREDYMLVKVKAVSLNPTDWKGFNSPPGTVFNSSPESIPLGAVVGVDYAGIVEAVPEGKAQKEWKVGDRISGFIHGSNRSRIEGGAFAEHIVATTGLALKIPDSLSFESASTLSCGIVSCGLGLYQLLKLPLPNKPTTTTTPILIYGGSTATGTLAIQYAKLSGLTVLTTCSPHNFDLVKSLGADYVFDYKSPTVIHDIQSAVNNKLAYIFDCISEGTSSEICYGAMGPEGGNYSCLLSPGPTERKDIQISMVNAYNSFNESYSKWGHDFPQDTKTYEFASEFMTLSEKLLAEGKLKNHPVSVGTAGFEGILEGLKELASGKVSGRKLAYGI